MSDTPDLHKEVLDEKKYVTGRISETTRYIGFGLLAFYYGIISSTEAFPQSLKTGHPIALKAMAACGLLAVMLDYFQYVAGRTAVQNALSRRDNPYHYNEHWASMRLRSFCFRAKQFMAVGGALLLIGIILFAA